MKNKNTDWYMQSIVRSEKDDEEFVFFRSNIQHMIKHSKIEAIKSILQTNIITHFYELGSYAKALYLLSCLDTICAEKHLPFCDEYEKYREMRLSEPLILCKDTQESLPIFARHNIFERSITDVF